MAARPCASAFLMGFTYFPKKNVLLLLGDAGVIFCAYVLALAMREGLWSGFRGMTIAIMAIAYLFTFYLLDGYDAEQEFRSVQYIFRQIIGVVIVGAALAFLLYLFPDLRSGRSVYVLSVALAGVGAYGWRIAYLSLFNRGLSRKEKLLIIGAGKAGRTLYRIVKDNPYFHTLGIMADEGFPLNASLPDAPVSVAPAPAPVEAIAGNAKLLRQMINAHQVDVLVLAISLRSSELLKAALNCKLDGVTIYDMPTFYEKITGKVPVEHVTDFWLVFAPLLGVKKNIYNIKLKRSIDVLLSFLGLVFTLPLALAVAAAIKIDSRGPVLYRQKRVGLNGNVFTLLKFRSMHDGRDGDRRHAGERCDPRITRVGKVIRHFRLDELPQVWNVLKGQMSFIGPRALIQEEVDEFKASIPYFSLRHSITPGITGWAQINYKHGKNREDGLEKLQYDLFYIKNLSPFLDFLILFKTVKVVLFGKGAR
jgi:exopolysaccharide biosynthesis polyprenyl glycosylphosphotransferase